MSNICVYASSSEHLAPEFYDLAFSLGKRIAGRGDTLVFGAGTKGLMGSLARGAKSQNGNILGIIPEALNLPGIVYEECSELVVAPEMRSRKQLLDARSDAMIALPGGFGTLEEVSEMITAKQLGYHSKPIIIFNAFGFYDNLLKQFEEYIAQGFALADCRKLYFVTDSIDEMLDYIDSYRHSQRNVHTKYR